MAFVQLINSESESSRQELLSGLTAILDEKIGGLDPEKRKGIIYCYLAHEVNQLTLLDLKSPGEKSSQLIKAQEILHQIGTDEGQGEER